ncbi:MAG: UDP-4-amino-4,6-dideoxy-N-acetyl-beta-L-altrosamine transaminase [Desulfobulbus sp.]|jgi:UDP-4-amino-4,6-dideoxy-N-acetyl-beta-L-altrosamine transaminase
MIPYGRQEITKEDIEAVVAVLHSKFLTQGPAVPRFEQAVLDHCGATHAVAVNSATSALHIACLALGLGPGDRLWTSPNTFVASANCALYCGAMVDFADIDPHTYNLSPHRLEEKLIAAQQQGCLPKIVIPVHFAGQPCDMEAIHALSLRYGFRIIEDASHAIGGTYQGGAIGNCRYSDITVFSFHPVKIITSAEGGMAVTNDARLAQHMQQLRSHGITRDPLCMETPMDGPWFYQQLSLGYNYRMTDLQAALGASQATRIEQIVTRRRSLAMRYNTLLADLPLTLPWQDPAGNSAFHLYVIRLHLHRIRASRRQVVEALSAEGIRANVHYIPVHTQPYYRAMGFRAGDYPEAEQYYREAISLPLYPGLNEAEHDKIVHAVKKSLMM